MRVAIVTGICVVNDAISAAVVSQAETLRQLDFVDSVDVTLIFDDGTEITVMAPVRSIDGMDMGGDMTETTDG